MGFSEIISSVFGGGVTGLLGAAISRFADYKNKQLDLQLQKEKFSNEIELKHADARIMELEWQSRERIALTEGESKESVAETQAFQTALTSEPKLYHNPTKLSRAQNAWMVLVDGIRGLIRPVLTLYLCGISTAVYMQAGSIIKHQPLSPEQSMEIYTQISSTILYLTTTCVLFYFGSRPAKQGRGK